MSAIQNNRAPVACRIVAFGCCSLLSPTGLADGVAAPEDGNSRLAVLDVRSHADAATILYYTYPDRGDAGVRNPCAVNVYTVTLQPGLPQAASETAATGICGVPGTRGRLLSDGGLLILAQDRLQHWQGGRPLASVTFSTLEATKGLDVNAANAGQVFDIAATGDSLVALPLAGGKQRGSGAIGAEVLALDRLGKLRWRLRLESAGERVGLAGIRAGEDGGALLQIDAMPAEATTMAVERRLYPVSPTGKLLQPLVISKDRQPDMASLGELKPEDMSRLGELLQSSYLESIGRISTVPRPPGGFDVLIDRSSGKQDREGHFLYRIDAGGQLEEELDLTDRIAGHGLDRWVDFRIEGRQLLLLSQVTASQSGVQARRTKYPQTAISRMSLDTGASQTRLMPLDRQYLAAVLNAGDEQLQRIDNRPGGEPVRLGRIGDTSLAVSIGYLDRRAALRLDIDSDRLPTWDEAFRAKQAEPAREQSRH